MCGRWGGQGWHLKYIQKEVWEFGSSNRQHRDACEAAGCSFTGQFVLFLVKSRFSHLLEVAVPVTAPARAWGQQGATATGSTCVSPTGHPIFLICLWAPSGDKSLFLGVKLLTLGKDQGFLFSFNPFVLVLMLHLGVFSPCNQAHLCFIPTLLHQCFLG